MSTYPNGKIPDRLLIRRGDFLLTAGTWAKFDDLVARVKRRTGVTLRISTGSTVATKGAGAFRTYAMQVDVKKYWTARGQSRMAAAPGYSSHGGEYKGDDALAIDITNYSQIPLSVFFEEGRAAGFQMGYFDGNGKPYEPWHIIDRDPYRTSSSPAGTTTGEWDAMATKQEIKDAVFEVLTGVKLGPGGRNHFDSLKFIADGTYRDTRGDVAAAVAAFPVPAQDGEGRLVRDGNGNPVTYQLQGYLASIAAQVGGQVAEVDENAIAQALAPLLTSNIASLSDEDVQRIATAAADEQARRLKD
jgi:hypothetical protein